MTSLVEVEKVDSAIRVHGDRARRDSGDEGAIPSVRARHICERDEQGCFNLARVYGRRSWIQATPEVEHRWRHLETPITFRAKVLQRVSRYFENWCESYRTGMDDNQGVLSSHSAVGEGEASIP